MPGAAKIVLVLLAVTAANAQFTGSPFSAGASPQSVAVGDFNLDGKPDLVTANSSGNNVTVLLRNGSGGFTAGSPFSAGTNPQSVAVGDFNGDGKPDLAVANTGDNTVTVLLGNGSGQFTAAAGSPFAVGASPAFVAAADFNGDGQLDLVTANSGNNTVTVLLGNGSGGFTAAAGSPIAVGSSPRSMAVGDFNGDGNPDLVTTDYSGNTITVLLGNGSGGFTAATGSPFATGVNPSSVAAGDFNGDGKLDLVTSHFNDNTVTVLLGDGTGGFTAAPGSPFAVGVNPASVAVGDFNGDGNPDLATANFSDNTVTLLLGNGAGGFTPSRGSPFAVGTNPSSLAAADFNGDGQADLSIANSGDNTVTTLLNTLTAIAANPASLILYAAAGQAASTAIPVSVSSATPGSTYTASSNRAWLTPTPTSNATAGATTVHLSANPVSLTAGIYMGTVRYIAPNFFDAATSVTFNVANPSGTLQATAGSPLAVGLAPQSVAVGDFNGDGKPDLVTANYAGDNVTVLLGDGAGGFTAAPGSPFAAGTTPASVAVGDFNGDGKPDLVTANTGGNNVTILLGDGAGGFSPAPGNPFAVGSNPLSVAVGDFNGDGKLDIVTANNGEHDITVLLGNGSSGFSPAPGSPFQTGLFPQSVVVGDGNGDGRPDIIVANSGSNAVTIFFGTGSGGFTGPGVFLVGSFPQAAALGDLNGDGKIDIVAANSGDNTVTVLLGNGSGGFTAAPGSPFGVGSDPLSVIVVDVNGDGKPDIVTANVNDNTLTVLLGNGSGGFTPASGSPFATGANPFSVAAGDFNGDGRLDLAAANIGENAVTVLLGMPAATSSVLSTTAGASVGYGIPIPLTLTVTLPSGGFRAPSGTGTFLDGVTPIGTSVQTGSPYLFSATGLAPGSHTLTASYGGDSATASSASNTISVAVTQTSQTIAFSVLPNKAMGSAPFTVSATATSSLAVSFASTTSPVCTAAGAIVTLVSVGVCTIQATQPGNTGYAAAPPVSRNFNVTPSNQTVTFGVLSNQAFGSAPFTVSATASSGLAVSFASTTAPVCTVTGATVTLLIGGTCTIQATQAGNAGYAAATPVSRSFTVTAVSQTVTFGALSNQAFGTAPFTVSATASSSLAVTFTSTTASVCTVAGATVTLVSGGSCTIRAAQAGNSSYSAATPVNQTFTVTQASQTITFGALPDKALGSVPFAIGATASSGLAVGFTSTTSPVCTASGSTVTLLSTGTCTIQASQAGSTTYSTAVPVNQTFTVTQGSQTITFGALSNRAFGSAPLAVTATASSHLAVSFLSTSTPVCTVTAATVTLLSVGVCTIEASQPGDGNYAAATPVDRSFNVTPSSQTITFGALSSQPLNGAPFTVSATASSGLAVAFASTAAPVCTVSGATVTTVSGGVCTIQATQSGNATYAAAPSVSQHFTVTPGSQTIVFGALSTQPLGTAPFTVTAAASSSLAVTFTSTTAPVCTVTGAIVTLVSAGSCTIRAAQAGNSSYAAAPPVTQTFAVTQGNQTVIFGPLSNQPFGATPFTVSATASSRLTVSFVTAAPSVCTVSGVTVTLVIIGTCTIEASQAGNSNYSAATPVDQSFTVTPGSQTITFGPIPNKAFGSAPFTIAATASSRLVVSFASDSGVCSVSNVTVTLALAGSCTIHASQAGNGNYAAATPVTQNFTVTPSSQTITFGALPNQAFGTAPFTVSATASSGLAVDFASTSLSVCTVSGATVILMSAGVCTIQATQPGNPTYAPAPPVNQHFTVTKGNQTATQTIAFGAISNQALATASFTISASATSGLAVTFTSTTLPVCDVSGATVILVSAGVCSILATQPGNATYAPAPPVNRTFTVGLSSVTVASVLNAGSYSALPIAADGYTVAFGSNFSTATAQTSSLTLPVTLAGATVTITDSSGATLTAPLYYVSPAQINFLVPEGLAAGAATITITNASGNIGTFRTSVAGVSPSLFSADSSGQGVPAAIAVAYASNGSTQVLPVFNCAGSPVVCAAVPIDLGPSSSIVYLELYGTGIRGRSSLAGVSVTLGGTALQPTYAGAQATYAGLDQVNVPLNRSLIGKGLLALQLTVDGIPANPVSIDIK